MALMEERGRRAIGSNGGRSLASFIVRSKNHPAAVALMAVIRYVSSGLEATINTWRQLA